MVFIVLGSESDMEYGRIAQEVLKEFGVEFELHVASAHRTPSKLEEVIKKAEEKAKVVIAMAGYAAHLPGVIASKTLLPVIGVPLDTSPLKGLDALFSIVQMPKGVPVLTVGIGRSGARNAALAACHILALQDESIKEKLLRMRRSWEEG